MSLPSDPRAAQRPTVVLSSNTAWSIANFRLGLARGLVKAGYHVVTTAPPDEHVARIEAAGLPFVPMPMNRKGRNPLEDLGLLWRYRQLLARLRPVAYLGWTIKPNVYGGMACRQLGIPSIHNIAGLGYAFAQENLLTRVARQLYRWGLGRADTIFFQNEEDRQLMLQAGIVPAERTQRLPGSGVDITQFAASAPPPLDGQPFRLLMCARLLREKGFADLVEAARLLRAQGRLIDIRLLGQFDVDNPSALSPQDVQTWVDQGWVTFLGGTDDVRPHIAAAHAVVLPSYYREGLPRILLEAASMGRPIITTDSVGCRDAIVDGQTGLLCRPQDPSDLAAQITRLLDLPEPERLAMGQRARQRVEQAFDEQIVVQQYLLALTRLLTRRNTKAMPEAH
jgi:glycosyltransferase involved in cell wall biosynthesis